MGRIHIFCGLIYNSDKKHDTNHMNMRNEGERVQKCKNVHDRKTNDDKAVRGLRKLAESIEKHKTKVEKCKQAITADTQKKRGKIRAISEKMP
jgi:hypothetical protein